MRSQQLLGFALSFVQGRLIDCVAEFGWVLLSVVELASGNFARFPVTPFGVANASGADADAHRGWFAIRFAIEVRRTRMLRECGELQAIKFIEHFAELCVEIAFDNSKIRSAFLQRISSFSLSVRSA